MRPRYKLFLTSKHTKRPTKFKINAKTEELRIAFLTDNLPLCRNSMSFSPTNGAELVICVPIISTLVLRFRCLYMTNARKWIVFTVKSNFFFFLIRAKIVNYKFIPTGNNKKCPDNVIIKLIFFTYNLRLLIF